MVEVDVAKRLVDADDESRWPFGMADAGEFLAMSRRWKYAPETTRAMMMMD